MRSELKVILVTLLLAGVWAAGTGVPNALARVDAFRIRDIEVRGANYLTEAEVRDLVAVEPGANLWTDTDRWKERAANHRMVKSVAVERRMPGTLIVSVLEREPVALVATPLLEPIDYEGRRLPIDPTVARLDLPVLATRGTLSAEASWVPAETRRLVREVARLAAGDSTFLERVSEVGWRDDGTLFARWSRPEALFLLQPGTHAARVREGLAALAHAVEATPDVAVVVDLRFADQVVVRRGGRS